YKSALSVEEGFDLGVGESHWASVCSPPRSFPPVSGQLHLQALLLVHSDVHPQLCRYSICKCGEGLYAVLDEQSRLCEILFALIFCGFNCFIMSSLKMLSLTEKSRDLATSERRASSGLLGLSESSVPLNGKSGFRQLEYKKLNISSLTIFSHLIDSSIVSP
ncbi:hypothetical protein GOODEAATRI_022786, partial [Goodea atripinnis]